MTALQSIIIAVVEGLTEFLPVSSTGHIIITEALLGVKSTAFVRAFTVIIQLGAIISVILLYWERFFKMNKIVVYDQQVVEGMSFLKRHRCYFRRSMYKFDFYWKLLYALIPAGIFGLLLNDYIDALLDNVAVVTIMLVAGGVFMLFVDRWFDHPSENQSITAKRALEIGLCQCIAMIPGVSRSMATIVGGMGTKLNRKNAAEFSFFLAVPTMLCASIYKLVKLSTDSANATALHNNVGVLILGCVVAFVVAALAIKFFINYLSNHGFKAFGWYRIIIGGVLLIMMVCGMPLSM